jgi:hypothetical protein
MQDLANPSASVSVCPRIVARALLGVIARRVRPSVRSYARGEVSLQFHPAHMAKTTWPQPCGRGLFARLARPQRERSRLLARASFRGASHPFQQAHLLPWTVDHITKWVGTTLGRGARYLGHRCFRCEVPTAWSIVPLTPVAASNSEALKRTGLEWLPLRILLSFPP